MTIYYRCHSTHKNARPAAGPVGRGGWVMRPIAGWEPQEVDYGHPSIFLDAPKSSPIGTLNCQITLGPSVTFCNPWGQPALALTNIRQRESLKLQVTWYYDGNTVPAHRRRERPDPLPGP